MDTNPATEKRDLRRLSAALSSAFSEWILIILLLIDAFFLYLATKLCHSCKLQTPCLLCSRFCYLLGNEKLGFYRNLVCDSHKLEISSLAFCHVHQKLANAREMCEMCFLSFSKKMSSVETCKFFLSKLGMDLDEGDQILNAGSGEELKVPLLKKAHEVGSPRTKPCSCCSQPSRNTPYPFQLFQNKAAFKEFTFPESPLSGTRMRAWVHLPDGWSKAKEILPVPLTDDKPGDHSFFNYRELKITSESESEFPLSDEEDRSKKARGTADFREESLKSPAPKKSSAISDNIVLEKLIHPDPAISGSSASDLRSPHHEDGSCDKLFADSGTDLDHGWNEKPNPPISSELVAVPVATGISNGVDGSRTSIAHVEIKEGSDLVDITSRAEMVTSNSDHNISSEIALVLESARLHEDLKQRLSLIPSPRCLQYPWTDSNSQRPRKDDECKLFHSSSFHGLPNFNRASNVEVLFSESADGNIVREVESEVAVGRLLKGQIEMDRKSLSILYKELEEERNASAIAANQAMAMITKLQEEKAAMQLEVMQYCRLMEEQTDHDQEAIRNLNEQLTERDKEIQDLEAELESCRKLCGDESFAEKVLEQSSDSDESEYSTTSTPHISRYRGRKKHHRARAMLQDSAWISPCPTKENLLDFEDERQCISECLKKLEKNVCLFSNAGDSQHDGDDELDYECFGDDDAKRVKFQQGFTEDERNGPSLRSQNTIGGMISTDSHASPNFESLSLDENCSSPSVEPQSPIGEHDEYNGINYSCSTNKNLKRSNSKGGSGSG
ncbi:hypothetical protein KSP39_PZI010086 [Platanthera zijinensis]|uniref:GTD-binding domain-containing protein n=1 Tax=Platanthera zijinensis TaxID=2320716 RepID=A0AAP0G6X5_9ASPA